MNELQHHGILGQKWGVRRYQNYDGSLTDAGAKRLGRTKYTNIDGSINEKGKLYKTKFAQKEIDKNNKYYDKYIKKYQKVIDKNPGNAQIKKQYSAMIKSAEASRKAVNESIKNFQLSEMRQIDDQKMQKVKTAAKIVGGTAASAALATTVPMLAARGAVSAVNFLNQIDPVTGKSKIEDMINSPAGKKAQAWVETGIRSYSDVNAYVFSIYADQMLTRMQQTGVLDQVANTINTATKASDAYQKVNSGYNSAKQLYDVANTFYKKRNT